MAEINVGGIRVFDAAASLQGAAAVPTATGAVELVRLGSFVGTGTTAAGRAESLEFDAASDRLFITNAAASRIDIAKVDAQGDMVAAGGIDLAGLTGYGGVNSVAVKNGVVAVAYGNSDPTAGGYVALFDASTGALTKLIQVGVLPDQLTFTADGKKLLVANEGEPISAANNPVGSVSIIDMTGGAKHATVANTIGFTGLNGSEAALQGQGLALFPGQAAAADIEPEYIAISPDGTRAYVTLQEVNAVAVIDLTNPNATQPLAIQPLGGIDRSLSGNQFDPNDQNGISLINAKVTSLLQPDAIATFKVGGATYFITANEGDARVGGATLLDEARLSQAANYNLDPTAYPDAAIKTNAQLGRLNVITSTGDTDGDSDIDQITSYGGRGVSIFRQNADGTITKVRETGGEFERIIAQYYPALHNTENLASVDTRSDNKGPEPESVAVGAVGSKLYAFVTLERVGGVMVYDVTDPANASFVQYQPATNQDFAPEVVKFISAADSPTGQALLVSANEVSGTTTLYAIASDSESGGAGGQTLYGRSLADTLSGGSGEDTLHGNGGADLLQGGSGDDSVNGGEGDDEVLGQAGDDALEGSGGADTLDGAAGSDSLAGGAGADSLVGGSGADTLAGGADDDVLSGGSGGDIFVFGLAGGADIVTDFNVHSDLLDLSGQTAPIYGEIGGDALIGFADGSSIRLIGVSLGDYLLG